jgi:hypothetical protein
MKIADLHSIIPDSGPNLVRTATDRGSGFKSRGWIPGFAGMTKA